MKGKAGLVFAIGMVLLIIAVAVLSFRDQPPDVVPHELDGRSALSEADPEALPAGPAPGRVPADEGVAVATGHPQEAVHHREVRTVSVAQSPVVASNRLERLTQTRETFRLLAGGDRTRALLAAKQVTNETERETALLTLVTEWTKGELSPPRRRAQAIALYGLEAGLGIELAKDPDLAVLWANELTDRPGRAAILQHTAVALVGSDPAAALALGGQLPEGERSGFNDAVFAGWASKDTEAALQFVSQLSDPAEQEAAIKAVRSVAPVGIGAALRIQEGYPVINDLLPGTPAELSGQLRLGDRVLALAQGDNAFVDARNLSLAEVVQQIRGAPGTVLQLQVLASDAAPGSQPRTVSIVRDQIKFKQ